MAKPPDMKKIEKQAKATMASAKKALSTGRIKDPGKKKRGQILKALKAAAKIDEL